MSDAPQGPGWWQASDGRFYPPEQLPPPVYGGGPGARRQTEGMAVAAMVVGIVAFPLGCLCGIGWLGSPVALGLGIAARRRIRESGGLLDGEAMATAGIVLGSIGLLLILVVIAFIITGSAFSVFGPSTNGG